MGPAFGPPAETATGWVPLADVSETDDAYLVEVDLPGVKSKDINIEVVGNELRITGDVRQTKRKGLLRRKQRRVGEFEFRITLPHEVDDDRIEANLAEGALTVRFPKQETKSRPVEVTEGHRQHDSGALAEGRRLMLFIASEICGRSLSSSGTIMW